MSIFGAIVGGITKVAKTVVPALLGIHETRVTSSETQYLALAEKRDHQDQKLAIKRMEFDAKMEMMRQTVRAKEREEDQEFTLALKAMEAENLLKVEKARQAFQALEAEKQREFTQAIEKFKAELQIAIQADNIAFQKWKTETDQKFAIEIRYLDAQIARQRDKQNRDDAKRDRNSPVFAVADDILETIHNRPEMPLTVFFSPPVLRDENSHNQTHSVIEKEDDHTNPWGLVDMHGNVWEWCADSWTDNVDKLPEDGKPYINTSQSNRSLRGGSWYNQSHNCAPNFRNYTNAYFDLYHYGFRVVCL